MSVVRNIDLAIISWDDDSGIIEMFDMVNRRVIKRKVHYIGIPAVSAVMYQGYYQFTCNMGSVKSGEYRY